MRKLLLALATLIAVPTMASADDLSRATFAEHEASTRVAYYGNLTRIAERDLATAQLQLDMFRDKWNAAIIEKRTNDAGAYAKRYQQALHDQRDALGRTLLFRSERDIARDDFQIAVRDLYRAADRARSKRT